MKRLKLAAMIASVAACGGGMATVPATTASRASGQSSMMDRTLAGRACDPKNHDRPFVIEWDATDLSSFESRAATDVVFVRYENCGLEVIDGCQDDSVRGAFGAYKPVEWTAGTVEKLDVKDEGELYAKLPLAANLLGARVQAGEQFHMEYFVSGVRSATRGAVYRSDLARIAACKRATHFVSAYNLGAFELGTQQGMKGAVSFGAGGVGVGGERTRETNAVKRGGKLASCGGDTAKEVHTCKAPLRLTLREIAEGESPERAAAAEPPPANLTTKLDAMEKANEHRAAAMDKFQSKDGEGCVRELDAADKLDPHPGRVSTNPKGTLATRAMCQMLAGKCDAGKRSFRVSAESLHRDWTPMQLDAQVTEIAGRFCQGGGSPLDRMVGAEIRLREAVTKKDNATCVAQYRLLKVALREVKPADESQTKMVSSANHAIGHAIGCLAGVGLCKEARELNLENIKVHDAERGNKEAMTPSRAAALNASFEALNPMCVGKN